MDVFQERIINNSVCERFKKLEKMGRLAHAYLFIGPEGVGKFSTALEIARVVIGVDKESIDRLESGNHPDVHLYRSNRGETIKIEQIRTLSASTQLKPYEAPKKVFIVQNIENLTPESSNALLKTLEEPAKDSLIILTTSVPERVFATIISRCHAVFFPPCSKDETIQLLQKGGVQKGEASFLAMYTSGCLDKAKDLYDSGLMDRKNEIIDQMIFQKNSEPFIKKIVADKDATKELLDVLLSWHRDVLLLKMKVGEEQIINIDRIDGLKMAVKGKSFDEVRSVINEIVRAAKQLRDNLNVRVSLMVIKEQIWVR